ncbi:hypothetical protein [Xanthobacter variabilis]|uniref:hypothetical protein n=1 Tax=Xanthobacter variabilis TaxID=3119932 RepID=UPI00372AFCB0
MCSLCAALGGSRYWTDAAGREAFSRGGHKVTLREERERRVAFLDRMLAHYGLSIRDWGGNSYVLMDRRGRRENVYNLAGIWALVDTMAATECDPLDPALLARLAPESPAA